MAHKTNKTNKTNETNGTNKEAGQLWSGYCSAKERITHPSPIAIDDKC